MNFEIGQDVWARHYTKENQEHWVPAKITHRNDLNYEVETLDNRKWKRHIEQLRGRDYGAGQEIEEDEDDDKIMLHKDPTEIQTKENSQQQYIKMATRILQLVIRREKMELPK